MWQIFSGRKSLSIVIWKVIMKLKAKSADLLLVHLRRWFLRLFPLKLLDQLLWFLWSAHFILKSHQSVVIQELSYSVVKTSCLYQLITKVNNSPFCSIVFIWECFHYFLSSYLQPDTEDKYPRIEKTGGKVIQWQGARVSGFLAILRSISMSQNSAINLCKIIYSFSRGCSLFFLRIWISGAVCDTRSLSYVYATSKRRPVSYISQWWTLRCNK